MSVRKIACRQNRRRADRTSPLNMGLPGSQQSLWANGSGPTGTASSTIVVAEPVDTGARLQHCLGLEPDGWCHSVVEGEPTGLDKTYEAMASNAGIGTSTPDALAKSRLALRFTVSQTIPVFREPEPVSASSIVFGLKRQQLLDRQRLPPVRIQIKDIISQERPNVETKTSTPIICLSCHRKCQKKAIKTKHEEKTDIANDTGNINFISSSTSRRLDERKPNTPNNTETAKLITAAVAILPLQPFSLKLPNTNQCPSIHQTNLDPENA